jgi:hypothetical protein
MKKKLFAAASLATALYLTGCASVPTASVEEDSAKKAFNPPSEGLSGLYVYRNSNFGAALKKRVYVNDEYLGETAPMTYFYKEVAPGAVKLSTSSEFGNNDLMISTEEGKNYFVRQYIKLGVFVGGANLELVSEEEGKKGVLECKLAEMPNN